MRKLIALAFLAITSIYAQNTNGLMPDPRIQLFDNNGQALAGGKVFTYAAGTSTPLVTYTNSTTSFPNANPVILDSAGVGNIWLTPAYYKIVAQDANGVQQWSIDNVANLGLLNSLYTASGTGAVTRTVIAKLSDTVSIKDFGAAGDGVTDDTVAVGLACASAQGGTIDFPTATYVLSGIINTCSVGTTLRGNGSTLDISASTGVTFAINVNGTLNTQAVPTVIQGFRVIGNSSNAAAYLVRADRVPRFTMRDIFATSAQVIQLEGESVNSVLDNISVLQPYGTAFTFTAGTYSAGPDGTSVIHPSCNGASVSATCISVTAGLIYVTDPNMSGISKGFEVNGGALSVTGGTLTFQGISMTGINIISMPAGFNTLAVNGTLFQFVDGANVAGVGIANASSGATLNLSGLKFTNLQTGSTKLIKATAATLLNLTGSNLVAYTGSSAASIFDLTSSSSAQINSSTISGNTFFGLSVSPITFTASSNLGSINNSNINGNTFVNCTAFAGLANGTIVTNNLFTNTGAITFNFTGATTASLRNNYFTVSPTVTNPPTSTYCSINVGYGCL